MDEEQLLSLSVADACHLLKDAGRDEDAYELTVTAIDMSVIHDEELDDVFAMTMKQFNKMFSRPPSIPGYDTFAWGKAVIAKRESN